MPSTLTILGVLTAIVSIVWYHVSTTILFPSIPCTQDPPIEYGNANFDSCQMFSLDYFQAREKFRTLAMECGGSKAEVISLPIVGEEDYTMDIAILPGTVPGVILHTSGTHGIEGYAGSAIQLAFLESLKQQQQEEEKSKDRPTIILVHAVNPFGMANYRRYNEHNVDLNRNCIDNFPKFLQERHPNIAGYDDFKYFVSPPEPPSLWDQTLGWWLTSIPLILANGFPAMKQVVVAGQYHHPDGVFYGGTKLEPSIEKLMDFLESRQLLDQLLVHIDVHTGLGKTGKDTLVVESNPLNKDMGGSLAELFPSAEHIVTSDVPDKKAWSGYDLTKGTVPSFIAIKSNQECLAVTQEFGTIPSVWVGRALMLENAMYHHGGDDKQQCRKWMQEAFYPQSTAWRASIVQRGMALLDQTTRASKFIQPRVAVQENKEHEQHEQEPQEQAESEQPEEEQNMSNDGDDDDNNNAGKETQQEQATPQADDMDPKHEESAVDTDSNVAAAGVDLPGHDANQEDEAQENTDRQASDASEPAAEQHYQQEISDDAAGEQENKQE